MQYARRSSQLGSGGAVLAASGLEISGGSEVGMPAVQSPRCAVLFCSAQVMVTPPTHAASPQTSVLRSPFCSTTHVQSSFDDDEHATGANSARASETMRTGQRTTKEY